MTDFNDFFDGQNFEQRMRSYCAQAGWQMSQVDKDGLELYFDMPNGGRRAVRVFRYGKLLEFCSPSVFHLQENQNFREDLTNLLLRQNASLFFGFWCITGAGPGRDLVRYLVQTCDEFDQSIENQVRPPVGL